MKTLDNLILYRPVKGDRNVDWRLTQKRGERPEYYKKLWRPYHLWLDYAWPKPWQKVWVYASHPWIVRVLYDENWFGNYVVLDWWDYETYYAHLHTVDTFDWAKINTHNIIGIMWTTGNSSGVHLHFGLRLKDRSKGWKWWIDPTPYIKDWDYSTSIVATTDDPDIQALIDAGIRNGLEWEWMTKRIWKVIGKLYNKLKQ